MKAAIIEEFGPPDHLKIKDRPVPAIGPDDVLIQVEAAGLNPVDTKIRAGTHLSCKNLQLPVILGREVSGVIVKVGAGVKTLAPGQAVFALLPSNGGFAEFAVASAQWVIRKPAGVSFEAAAAVSLVGLTAYQALHTHLQLKPKERILIQAAAGGVGHLAVQFAKMAGAYVIGTASKKNAGYLSSLGVDQVIDYKTERFEEKAEGVDAVLDALGGDVLHRGITCVKPGGRVVCLPSATRDDPKAIELAKARNVRLVWPMMIPDREALVQIADWLERGDLQVTVSNVFTLEAIAAAHRQVESHGTRGKNVIRINL